MIAGAFAQHLEAGGLTPVFVEAFGDLGAATQWAVGASPGADRLLDGSAGALHVVAVQVRCRAPGTLAAYDGAELAFARMLAARQSTLTWTDPRGAHPTTSYAVRTLQVVNRPTWFAAPVPGQVYTMNFSALVKAA